MRRPILAWAGSVSLAMLAIGCAGPLPPSSSELPPPAVDTTRSTSSADSAKKVTPPAAPAVVQVGLIPDSTGPEPRPWVLIEKNNYKSVRTRLIPRVMGRGWTLSVNKGDSIEFLRNADPEMTALLFRSPPVSAARIRLRFRLLQTKEGIRIVGAAHLVGNSVYPYRAVSKVLEDNLAELRTDLMASPSSMAPLMDRVPDKKK